MFLNIRHRPKTTAGRRRNIKPRPHNLKRHGRMSSAVALTLFSHFSYRFKFRLINLLGVNTLKWKLFADVTSARACSRRPAVAKPDTNGGRFPGWPAGRRERCKFDLRRNGRQEALRDGRLLRWKVGQSPTWFRRSRRSSDEGTRQRKY